MALAPIYRSKLGKWKRQDPRGPRGKNLSALLAAASDEPVYLTSDGKRRGIADEARRDDTGAVGAKSLRKQLALQRSGARFTGIVVNLSDFHCNFAGIVAI